MKSHISATIDSTLVEELEAFSREERRSRSQVIELALDQFLAARQRKSTRIVTSEAAFSGKFRREDCYDR
ncbi:MAG TPA: ribbon-helix-helix protein, CopG family [Chthoniobacterales bacterium]